LDSNNLFRALLMVRCWIFAFIISFLFNYLTAPWMQESLSVESICQMWIMSTVAWKGHGLSLVGRGDESGRGNELESGKELIKWCSCPTTHFS
jgi:hypothetical protein